MRGVYGAIGLLVIGIAAAVASGSARAVTYVDPLTAASFTGFDRNLLPNPGPFAVSPGAAGAVFTKAAGAAYGGAELLSRFTFSGVFRLTVDAFGLDTELGATAESGLGLKAPGCCSPTTNYRYADIFGHGNGGTAANNYVGLTELSRTGFAGGDRLALAGDTGGEAFRLNLFLDQSFGGADANRITFRNLTVTADTITQSVPEPAAWSLLIAGFALIGAALRRRTSITTGN